MCLRSRKACSHFPLSRKRSGRQRASASLTFLAVHTDHSVCSCQIGHTLPRKHKGKYPAGARVLGGGQRSLRGISQKLLTMRKKFGSPTWHRDKLWKGKKKCNYTFDIQTIWPHSLVFYLVAHHHFECSLSVGQNWPHLRTHSILWHAAFEASPQPNFLDGGMFVRYV